MWNDLNVFKSDGKYFAFTNEIYMIMIPRELKKKALANMKNK